MNINNVSFHRVLLYISKGWDKRIINPRDTPTIHNKSYDSESDHNLNLPKDGWSPIEESATDPKFTHGHMIAYFVSRKASDHLPASDIKSISEHAYGLSERGHVQKN